MKRRVLLILTIITVAVIFAHSAASAADSTAESDQALGLLDRIVTFLHLPNLFNAYTIRKLAHFCEFAVYGFFLSATVHSYTESFKKNIFCILFFLLAVPVTDETIQYFSEGRSAQVRDVLIDFSGGLFGLLMCFLFVCIIAALKKRKSAE
ncbi:MAG: VanZ family protein [Acutalibacteraceae bacterium]|nr:VanZ family protein [Clostridia bacterium]MEE3450349.1 VanZ family protein [Acutalibacteraceae bacterium]